MSEGFTRKTINVPRHSQVVNDVAALLLTSPDVLVLNLLKPSFVYAVRPKTSSLVFKIKAPLPRVMPRLNRINSSVVLILWKCHSVV